jgi:hypothetical protein
MSTQPAPFEWHDAKAYLPPVGEIVRVYQLSGWAKFTGDKWVAVDSSGNHRSLLWMPEYWRKEYYPNNPTEQKG